MKKYTVKHLITSTLLSLTALVVGYALLSLPLPADGLAGPHPNEAGVCRRICAVYHRAGAGDHPQGKMKLAAKKPPMPADSAAALGWHGKTPPPGRLVSTTADAGHIAA